MLFSTLFGESSRGKWVYSDLTTQHNTAIKKSETHLIGLVVNYGISNTTVLEIP